MADEIQPVVQTPATEAAPALTPPAEPNAASRHDALMASLENPNWKPTVAATPEPVPKPEPVETKPAEATPGDTPAAEPVVVETKPADDALPNGIERPRLLDPTDQVIAALKKAQPHLTWAQCEARVTGAPAKAEPAVTEPEPVPDPLASLQAELADVDTKLKEWGESEGLPTPEVVALITKRTDLAAEIRSETKFRFRDQQSAADRQQADEAKAREAQAAKTHEAVARFPLIANRESALRIEADRLMALYHGSAFMDSPSAPIELAEIASRNVAQAQAAANGTTFEAEMLKLDTAAKPKAAPVAAVVPKVTTQPKITPAGGDQATRRPDQPETEADRFKAANDLSNPREKREALSRLLYA